MRLDFSVVKKSSNVIIKSSHVIPVRGILALFVTAQLQVDVARFFIIFGAVNRPSHVVNKSSYLDKRVSHGIPAGRLLATLSQFMYG